MVRTTTAKRKSPSLFDDDGDEKVDRQTSLYNFFALSKTTKSLPSASQQQTTKKKRPLARVSQSPKKAKAEQMYLDLGQRNFGTAECRLCGMLFVHGLQQDTETHDRVCKDYKSGVAFSNRIKCRSTVQPTSPLTFRIVEVRPSDTSTILREKVNAAASIAYADLGFSTNTTAASNAQQKRTAYLYIVEQKIVGLCLVERIKQAHRLLDPQQRNGGLTRASDATDEAVLGIHLLWIHRNHRRRGMAQSLINTACERMVYGYVVQPNQVAFSSPTTAGTRFAQHYCKRLDILVYDCV